MYKFRCRVDNQIVMIFQLLYFSSKFLLMSSLSIMTSGFHQKQQIKDKVAYVYLSPLSFLAKIGKFKKRLAKTIT